MSLFGLTGLMNPFTHFAPWSNSTTFVLTMAGTNVYVGGDGELTEVVDKAPLTLPLFVVVVGKMCIEIDSLPLEKLCVI